jgi:hypothetical protein
MRTVILPAPPPIRTSGLRITTIALGVSLSIFAQSTPPSAPHYQTPPTWPGEIAGVRQAAGRYVYITADREAIVIRPPTDWVNVHGKPPIIRYDLHNRLRPAVLVELTGNASVGYSYAYTISNGKEAEDSIQTWELVVPVDASRDLAVSGAKEWGAGASRGPAIIRQAELPDQMPGRVATWVQDNRDKLIGPGETQAGFHLRSPCRPGFSTALFSSGVWPDIDQEFPDAVFDQLDFYNDPTWRYVPSLTFGPMFCDGTSQQTIIQNMISGIKRSIATRVIRADSAFVREALADLAAVADGQPLTERIVPGPTDEPEREIFSALQLSLSFQTRPH